MPRWKRGLTPRSRKSSAAFTTTDRTCPADRQAVLIGNMRLEPNADVDAEMDARAALGVAGITSTSARGAPITESTRRRQS